MKKEIWTKGLVLSLIMLFIGASIVPIITGSTTIKTPTQSSVPPIGMQTTWTSFSLNTNQEKTTGTSSFPSDELPSTFRQDGNQQTIQGSAPLMVDTAAISQPMNNDIIRGGDTVEIQGTADGSTFQYYLIEWGVGEYPTTWFTTDIVLENGGLLPVINGSLGSWDTSFVEDEVFLTLRLTVNFTTYTSQAYIRNMCLDPTLKEGWPVHVPFFYDSQGGYYWSLGYLEPVVADINNDGYGEVIVYKPAIPQELQVRTYNGILLWSAPVGAPEPGNGGNVMLPVIDDINHDGFAEIIVYRFLLLKNYCELYVFDYNGGILDGWPIQLPKEYHPTVLCADVNLDGYDEIIFKGNDALAVKLSIVDHTGAIIGQWDLPPIHWGSQLVATPAVGNFDDDLELEIVCASPSENAGYNQSSGEWINEGYVNVFNLDGTTVPGWPIFTDGIIFTSPATGDINNDGKVEIMVALQFAGNAPDYRYGGLYAYDENANVLPGFPFEKGWNFVSAPGLADFDKDGDLEIACSRLGFYSYVIHHDGTLATGWPQQTTWNDYYSSIIGDITNDGVPDILSTAGNGFYPSTVNHGGVYAWEYDGTLIPGFPKSTEVDAQAPVSIVDMDTDGQVEIVASSNWDYDWVTSTEKFRGSIYVWDIDASVNESTMEWPVFHRDLLRTGMYPFVGRFLCDAGGPYTGKPGQPIQFDGSARYGTQPYTWAWDFGDGATSTEQNPTHTYTNPGTYMVALEVTDAASNTTTDSTTATIMICDAGGPYAGDVNEDIQFSGSASGGVTPYTWAWDFGDGATAVVQNPTHAYTTAGTFTATLTVTDAASNVVTDTATVTITEVPQPILVIEAITGGFGIKISVKNTGTGAATDVEWTVTLDGKLVFVGKSSSGTIATIAPAGEEAIKAGFILGFGKTNIVVTATCAEGASAEATASGFVLGPFVLGVK